MPSLPQIIRMLLALAGLALAIAAGAMLLREQQGPAARKPAPAAAQLAVPATAAAPDPTAAAAATALPANRWVRLASTPRKILGWSLQSHAGIALDTRRDRLLVFGSDTHGKDWDNTVHEFSLADRTWRTRAAPVAFAGYRGDGRGRAVAGPDDAPTPWAMHAYDEIVYDPQLDALVVVAVDSHNYPAYQEVQGVKSHPTWLWSPDSGQWSIFEQKGVPDPLAVPNFFASAAEYDPDRNVVWALKNSGLWYLDRTRTAWRQAVFDPARGLPAMAIHFTLVYDSQRRNLAVFGDYGNTRRVAVYHPGPNPADPGWWETRTPGGDPYPEDSQVPVAFDQAQGVFLLLPEEDTAQGRRPVTLLYDPDRNLYRRIPAAGAPTLMHGLHYLLAYDPQRRMFLLVNRSDPESTTVDVWGFRLDHGALESAHP